MLLKGLQVLPKRCRSPRRVWGTRLLFTMFIPLMEMPNLPTGRIASNQCPGDHRITASLRLEKTFKTIESNHKWLL